jgi:hypothetical protein
VSSLWEGAVTEELAESELSAFSGVIDAVQG